MNTMDHILKSAIAGVLVLAATETMAASTASPPMEKCYGIVKAGLNDCQTSTQSCASSSTKDNQPDAFIFLPKGDCQKIVGGSLTPKEVNK